MSKHKSVSCRNSIHYTYGAFYGNSPESSRIDITSYLKVGQSVVKSFALETCVHASTSSLQMIYIPYLINALPVIIAVVVLVYQLHTIQAS